MTLLILYELEVERSDSRDKTTVSSRNVKVFFIFTQCILPVRRLKVSTYTQIIFNVIVLRLGVVPVRLANLELLVQL